jgi:hypothetical protein
VSRNSVGDDSNLPDPVMLLMEVAIDTQQKEIGMQAGFSNLLGLQSSASINSMNIAQGIASQFAEKMEKDTSQSTMATDNATYNTMMTEISDVQNKYSNIMQAGGTIVTNLTQIQSQSLQLCQITVDFMNSVAQLITVWSN